MQLQNHASGVRKGDAAGAAGNRYAGADRAISAGKISG
jgi:hypothetical protein